MSENTREIRVEALSRVEGEGGLTVRLRDGRVESVELRIYEPPRFFEAFLRGRTPVSYTHLAAHEFRRRRTLPLKLPRQRQEVRLDARSKTAVAAPIIGGADRAATRLRHRPQTGNAPGHDDAHRTATLAIKADGVRRRLRSAAGGQRPYDFQQLMFVDRATAQLEINRNMVGNRRRSRQRCDVLRRGVYGA